MPTGRCTEFNRLVDALRHLDDSQLLSALVMAEYISQAAQPGCQQRKNTQRLKACELVVGERFRSNRCGGQA